MAIDGLYAGIVGAVGALIAIYIKDRIDDKNREEAERIRLGLEYFGPLRLFLEETYFRLNEIYNSAKSIDAVFDQCYSPKSLRRLTAHQKDSGAASVFNAAQALVEKSNLVNDWERCRVLREIEQPSNVSQKTDEWFLGEGVYLVSSCYLVACLFFYIWKLKEDQPYIHLTHTDLGIRQRIGTRLKHPFRRKTYTRDDDTILINLVNDVSRAFLQDHGVYYALQPAIGQKMYLQDQSRLITYIEFCEMLQNPEQRKWFDRLFYFFIGASGRGYFDIDVAELQPSTSIAKTKLDARMRSIVMAMNSIGLVSVFLDESVGGGPSIQKRLIGETRPDVDDSEVLPMHDLITHLQESLNVQRTELQGME